MNRGWEKSDHNPNDTPIAEDEKARFRDRLLPIMAASQGLVRQQLIPVLQRILHFDFPEKWPNFMDYTMQLLNTNDAPSVLAGLQCLLAICRAYRFKSSDGDNRVHFDKIIEASFPRLLAICNELVAQESDEAGEMLHLALKAYKHATWVNTDVSASDLVPLADRILARALCFPARAADQLWLVHRFPSDRFQDDPGQRHGRRLIRA